MAERCENVTNELLLEYVEDIQRTLMSQREAFRDVRRHLSALEMHYANISHRVDRIHENVSRIEARLDLVYG